MGEEIECSDAFKTDKVVDKCLLTKGAAELFFFMYLSFKA